MGICENCCAGAAGYLYIGKMRQCRAGWRAPSVTVRLALAVTIGPTGYLTGELLRPRQLGMGTLIYIICVRNVYI